MRILKYVLLILLLVAFAGSVFVATQRGDYEIEQSIKVELPKRVVSQFMSDFYNWDEWYADAPADRKYSEISTGRGAMISWSSSVDDGSIQTLAASVDSLRHRLMDDGMATMLSWKFTESADGTTITIKASGKLKFMPKVDATLHGGPNAVMSTHYASILEALRKTMIREIKSFSVKNGGIVQSEPQYFLGKSITSTIDNAPRNINIMMSSLTGFFEKNKMKSSGKPFVIYDYYDTSKNLTRFTVCIPVSEEIWVSPESDVKSGRAMGGFVVKTTLSGDYHHLQQAWANGRKYIAEKNLSPDPSRKIIEVYQTGKPLEKKPSRWMTDILIPVLEGSIGADPAINSALSETSPQVSSSRPKPAPTPPSDPEKANTTDEIAIP